MIKRKPPDNSKGGDRRSYEIVVDISGAPALEAMPSGPRHYRGLYKARRGIIKRAEAFVKRAEAL